MKKTEWQWLVETEADVFAIQETKASPEQLPEEITERPGWNIAWDSSTVRKGYSGVAIFSRLQPVNIISQLPDPRYRGEGRLLHFEYEKFHFFNGYFPNGGAEEMDENGRPTGKYKRVPYKLGFFDEFLKVALECEKSKPVVICGDFNIAASELDVANPDEHISGFLPEERAWMKKFMDAGFIDTFRYQKGPIPHQYTWWSYQGWARKKNIGWRLDYFFVSKSLSGAIKDTWIYKDVMGSDHCPIGLQLELP